MTEEEKPKVVTKEVSFHPEQYKAFTFTTQYGAAIAGVQSGKTFLGAFWAANNIAKEIGDKTYRDGLIGAPSYKILQQSTLPKFFKEFPQYRQFFKEQKKVIEIPIEDGVYSVYIRSFDDPLGVEGMTLGWAWLDEAGQMPQMAWTIIRSRTSTTKGRVLITTTPYNMGWLYQDFYLPWSRGEDKDLSVFTWKSAESPFFPKDFYEKEKKRLRPEEFRKRYEGVFTKMEGLVYQTKDWHFIREEDLSPDITIGGIDWGFTHPAAIVVVQISKGRYYVVDEWYETGKTTTQIIEAAQMMQNRWGVNRWYADSANPEKILEANQNTGLYVLGYEKKKDSISNGISFINQMLLENRIKFFDGLKHLRSELEAYHYPENPKPGNENPVPEDDHLLDALRYAIMGYAPAKRFAVPRPIGMKTFIQQMLDRKPKKIDGGQTSME